MRPGKMTSLLGDVCLRCWDQAVSYRCPSNMFFKIGRAVESRIFAFCTINPSQQIGSFRVRIASVLATAVVNLFSTGRRGFGAVLQDVLERVQSFHELYQEHRG